MTNQNKLTWLLRFFSSAPGISTVFGVVIMVFVGQLVKGPSSEVFGFDKAVVSIVLFFVSLWCLMFGMGGHVANEIRGVENGRDRNNNSTKKLQ